MNGIQKHFVTSALDAAREAAAILIATSKLSPVLVAESLEEFIQAIQDLDDSFVSKIPCNVEYRGRKANKSQSLIGPSSTPIFFQPSDKI